MLSTYRLYRVDAEKPQEAELIKSAISEKHIARTVFQTWAHAVCLPATSDGAQILVVWKNADDAENKRVPVAVVRTHPKNAAKFTQQVWKAPSPN